MCLYSFSIIRNKNKFKKFPHAFFETFARKSGYEIQQGFIVTISLIAVFLKKYNLNIAMVFQV